MNQKSSKHQGVAAANSALAAALVTGILALWHSDAGAAGITNDQALRIYNRVAGIPAPATRL
jgi:hypothetical protein